MDLGTVTKGYIAEKTVILTLLDAGYHLYEPVIDHGTDLLVETKKGFCKIQVKKMTWVECRKQWIAPLYRIARGKKYDQHEVDYFAVVCGQQVHFIANDGTQPKLYSRTVMPPMNLDILPEPKKVDRAENMVKEEEPTLFDLGISKST